MGFRGAFGAAFPPAFDPGLASAAVPWWLAGGVAAGNCVAAYQAKGAASYAASKVNLANPGTYDAANGTAYPTWDAATGWAFNGVNQYLSTSVNPSSGTWSYIIRYDGLGTGTYTRLMGTTNIFFERGSSDTESYFMNFAIATTGGLPRVGAVLCMADRKCYHDAVLKSTMSAGTGSESNLIIGSNIVGSRYAQFKGVAVAIYSSTLTATQVAAITAAMQAL